MFMCSCENNSENYVHCIAMYTIFFCKKLTSSSSKLSAKAGNIRNIKVKRMHAENL
jgi:hypothetical protein